MKFTIQDVLKEALAHQQQGRFREADRLYQEVLKHQPNNADALHLAGVLAMQVGKPALAVERILRAIAIAGNADFYSHLGEAYRRLGNLRHATEACRAALRIDPSHVHGLNNLGVVLLEQGATTQARDLFAQAVRFSPGFAIALNNLGNALRLLGDRDGALAAFRRAVEAAPAYGEAHSNLGQLLLDLRQRSSALEHCRRAAALQPDLPQAHNNLGNALREAGLLDQAKQSYAQALRLDPRNALILGNMAQALQEEGHMGEALAWYQRALDADPSAPRTYANLASCLQELERFGEARKAYEEALTRDPMCAEAHAGLGSILGEEGGYDQALAHYHKAIAAKPDFSPAYTGLAVLYTELGRLDEAERRSREAIRCDPEDGAAFAMLAELLGRRLPDEDFESMRRLERTAAARASRMLPLHFGLARALDARGQFAEAAEQAKKGNALQEQRWKRRGQEYNPDDHRAFVQRMCATFTPALFERCRGLGAESELPVFIVGLPRSGTTLLEQILANHSQVHASGELKLVRECFDSLPTICGTTGTPFDCILRLDEKCAGEAASRYLGEVSRWCRGKARVTDKMPDNYLYVGLLHVLFPNARIIHCRRDLRDIALSCWLTRFRSITWASKQEHIAERIHEYVRISEYWRRVLPNRMLEVRYEEMVENMEAVTRRVLDWLALDWEDQCLKFHESPRPVRTASLIQVREPVYQRSVARWKGYDPFMRSLFDQLPSST
ncbi:MAG: tetratricopeptide repeat protein [Candidatus Binataceae bacterium]